MLTRRRVALALTTVAALGSSALAVQRSGHSLARASHEVDAVVLPAAGVTRPLRTHVEYAHQVVPARRGAAWQRLVADMPGMTQASWDRATGVPSRIWGRGIDVPGSVANPDIAAAAAWRFLVAHIELVAPGAAVSDFELVANVERRGVRTLGFVQRHGGLPVFGGQVNFRFKADRLFVVGSEALPDVRVAPPSRVRAGAALGITAAASTALDLGLAADRVSAGTAGPLTIVPLVGDDGVLGYRVAVPVEIDGGAAGKWQVFTDPASGAPLVRRSLTRFGAGTVAFDAVERWTGRARRNFPAPGLSVTVGGASATTGADGGVTWSGAAPVTVMTSVTGPLVNIENRAGDEARTSLSLDDAGMGVWIAGNDRELDAQLSTYVHAHEVKEYARTFAAGLPFLDEQLPVRVNIDDECNAFSDGTSINFFRESDMCSNTGTIADVVYHEFGHSLHSHSLIPGVGFFDGAFSEGLSDYLSATMLNDSGMGRGFFKTDAPLRELNPVGSEAIWPRDIGEIHTTGIIYGGTMWDLRTALIEAKGYEAGVALADQFFYAAVQRAPSIPATLIEVLVEDDDDGDLTNGTPNECIIRAAYGRHGMRTVGGTLDANSIVPFTTTLETFPVTLSLEGLDTHCGDNISEVILEWKPRASADSPRAGTAPAMAGEGEVWSATMPLPDDGDVAQYHMRVKFADESEMIFPDNRADPWFQVYRGDVMPLYCTDFESDPFAEGWVADGDGAWQWGVPGGSREFADPAAAYSGTRILGTGLSSTAGGYPDDRTVWIESPRVETGQWSDVRLHYRRWLGVEDGFYDQATIHVNGEQAWANVTSMGNSNRTQHHEDRAWVFNDVALSSRIFEKHVTVRWQIDADAAFELGGWNLDDVCIVANVNSVCGDGRRSPAEQCDNGAANSDEPDSACRTTCRVAYCGDGIVDSNEPCDDGNTNDDDACNTSCIGNEADEPYEHPGCCSTGGSPRSAVAPFGLGLFVLGVIARRRRRRRGEPAGAP